MDTPGFSERQPIPPDEPLTQQIQHSILAALTNDYAQTVETFDSPKSILSTGKPYLYRMNFYKWDGLTREERLKLSGEDLRTGTKPKYWVGVAARASHLNIEKLAKEETAEDTQPRWPDRIDVTFLENDDGKILNLGLIMSNPNDPRPSGSLVSSSPRSMTETDDPLQLGVLPNYSGQTKTIESTLRDLHLINDVLTQGSPDMDTTRRTVEYLETKRGGHNITDVPVLIATNKYITKVMNQVMPAVAEVVDLKSRRP